MSCKYSLCSAVPCVRWKFSPSSSSKDILLRIIYPGLLPPSDKGFGFNLFISSFLHPSQVICQGNIISLVQSCPTLTNTSYSEPKKKKKNIMRTLKISHPPDWIFLDTSITENLINNFA